MKKLFFFLFLFIEITCLSQKKCSDYIKDWANHCARYGYSSYNDTVFIKDVNGIIGNENKSLLLADLPKSKTENSLYFYNDWHWLNINLPNNNNKGVAGSLLGLARIYFVSTYLYPYKEEIVDVMNSKLPIYIDKLMKSDTELNRHLILLEYSCFIKDSHGSISVGLSGSKELTDFFGVYRPSTILEINEGGVIIQNSTLKKIKPFIGDTITSINNVEINHLIDSLKPYINTSTTNGMHRDISWTILCGSKNTTISFKTKDGDVFSLKRNLSTRRWGKEYFPRQKTFQKIGINHYYVAFGNVKSKKRAKRICKKLTPNDTLIIDLTSGGNNIEDTWIQEFALNSNIPCMNYFCHTLNKENKFIKTTTPMKVEYKLDSTKRPSVILLINENTFSHTEYVAMKLKTYCNALIIGKPSNGTDGDNCYLPIYNGFYTFMTGLGIEWPNSDKIQRVGLIPDVPLNFNSSNKIEKITEYVNNVNH